MLIPTVIITDNNWSDKIKNIEILVQRICQIITQSVEVKDKSEVTIKLSNDFEIQELNKTYRSKDKPTNVLAFPDGELSENSNISLGDIIIAFETVEKESEEQNKYLRDHFVHMVIHGILHLLGYDHIKDEDAEIMEDLEQKIINNAKL